MEILNIKERLHTYIDSADDYELRRIEEIINSEESEFSIPENFYQELEKRRERHLNGESKSYTWEEVQVRAKSK